MAAAVAEVSNGVRRIAAKADVDNIDGWWSRVADDVLALVAAGFEVARQLAEIFLFDHAEAEGLSVEPVLAEWNQERAETSLRVTGPVAFKESIRAGNTPAVGRVAMANVLAGSAERLALAGERETVQATVDDSAEIVGWRRVGDGDPCAFCAMLISRGAVYKSGRTAGDVEFGGAEYHDSDGCTAVPLYEHEEEPDEVDDLYRQWLEVTAGESGTDALRAWRQYWDGGKPLAPTRRASGPARQRPEDVESARQASQQRAERAGLTGSVAAEIEEAVHSGAGLDAIRDHVESIVQRELERDPSDDIQDAVVQMRVIAGEAESVGGLVKGLWALANQSGGRRIGEIGDQVQADPELHEFSTENETVNAEVVWPGVRLDDGTVLQKAVVHAVAETAAELRKRIAARRKLPLLERLVPFTDEEGEFRDEEVFEELSRALNGKYGGLEVRVVSTAATANGVEMVASIHAADGKPVGTVQRLFERGLNEFGQEILWAYHDLLELKPEVQGQGFARAWNDHLERMYREAGYSHIKLLANIDVGGYAWARQGYDWADLRAAEKVAHRLRGLIDELHAGELLGPRDLREGEEMLKRFKLPFGSPDFPTALEVSQLGRRPGRGREAAWLGKSAMLGSSWHGVRWLE